MVDFVRVYEDNALCTLPPPLNLITALFSCYLILTRYFIPSSMKTCLYYIYHRLRYCSSLGVDQSQISVIGSISNLVLRAFVSPFVFLLFFIDCFSLKKFIDDSKKFGVSQCTWYQFIGYLLFYPVYLGL